MSTFPPRMRFPWLANSRIENKTVRAHPFMNFVDFTCEGHRFTTIVNHPDDIQEDRIYYFTALHLVIPKYFSKVDVSSDGIVLNESNPEFGFEISRLFAMGLRRKNEIAESGIWNGKITFGVGTHTCPLTANNVYFNSENTTLVVNINQLFFRFHNHYFTPIIISNGTMCYYAFENKKIIKEWVEKLSLENEYLIEGNSPIYFDNILRVPVTKDVALIPLVEEQDDDDTNGGSS